jgi:leucyl-tRNA---protein transferase
LSEVSRDTPQFFLTAPTPCPYLPGQVERKVFTQLVGDKAPTLHHSLTAGGFRRSQSIIYRPACEGCRACISVRVRAQEFVPSRNHRRMLAKNADLVGTLLLNSPTIEQYDLFRAYVENRHADGGMVDMSLIDYAAMIEDSHVDTRIVEYRTKGGGDLVGVSLIDVMQDGLSMVYSFYDPELPERSLGTFMILDHIQRARALPLPYVFLGYWVKGSDKMGYKRRFQPMDMLTGIGWMPMPET